MNRAGASTLIMMIPLAVLFLLPEASFAAPVKPGQRIQTLYDMIEKQDYLGARILIKKARRPGIRLSEWYRIREILFRTPQVGNDVIFNWVRKKAPAKAGKGAAFDPDRALREADELANAGKYRLAIPRYQEIAKWLKRRKQAFRTTRSNVDLLYPYVLHALARAFFAERRFTEALEVYSWLDPDYPRFRQVLFERMWAYFKSGRVDLALGAIASQRSEYFSKYLEPETYIIQVYLFKALCRTDDLKQVMLEIDEFKESLKNGKYNQAEWAKSDLDSRAMLNLTEQKVAVESPWVTPAERASEQALIAKNLQSMYQFQRKRLWSDLTLVQAYSQLAITPGMASILKPIERLPSREALFRSNLEIWPADSAEVWIDEVGQHRFIGESLCAKKN